MLAGWGSGHARIESVAGHRIYRAVIPSASSDPVGARAGRDGVRQRVALAERPVPRTGPAPELPVTESLEAMGARAAQDAAARIGLGTDDVDCVLVASLSKGDERQGLAHAVADRLDGSPRAALDVNAGSGGYCAALELGRCLVSAGTYERVLVVGTERPPAPGTAARRRGARLTAGAGAVLLQAGDEPGVSTPAWGSGAAAAQVARTAVQRAGLRMQDIRALVSHRHPGARTGREGATLLSLARDVVVSHDPCLAGAASAASVPMAMAALLAAHPWLSGQPALLVGFGAEFSLAAQVVRLP